MEEDNSHEDSGQGLVMISYVECPGCDEKIEILSSMQCNNCGYWGYWKGSHEMLKIIARVDGHEVTCGWISKKEFNDYQKRKKNENV